MRAMTRSPCRRVPRRLSAVAERHLRESGGPTGGTTGGYIDSFENMPGAQNQPFGSRPTPAFFPRIGLTVHLTASPDATWLPAQTVAVGIVTELVPGQLLEATTVVRLERSVDAVGRTGRQVSGRYVVLEPAGPLRRWSRSGFAHAEVWSEPPSAEPWLQRHAGVWVDAAAHYSFI